jgi:hypothetical protein
VSAKVIDHNARPRPDLDERDAFWNLTLQGVCYHLVAMIEPEALLVHRIEHVHA